MGMSWELLFTLMPILGQAKTINQAKEVLYV
jgi:hypothetical protein